MALLQNADRNGHRTGTSQVPSGSYAPTVLVKWIGLHLTRIGMKTAPLVTWWRAAVAGGGLETGLLPALVPRVRQPRIRELCRPCLWVGVCLMGLLPTAASGREVPEAERFVHTVEQQVVEVLKRTGADEPQRIREIADIMEVAVDLETIGRVVLGRQWLRASDHQRRDFVVLFRAHMLATLARRFASYSGTEQFVVTGSRAVGADDIMVSTQILYVNYPPLNVGWRVRNGQQRLRIVDVVVEEISFVVTNRAEFASIVERRGMDGLLQDLRARAPEPR
jgi:phospholipid transport system substrate-binding protein